jgi:hypothetical protein
MKKIANQSITSWLEWRYFLVWADFKYFMLHHTLYISSKGIHEQDNEILLNILHEYFKSFGLNCTSTYLDAKMKRTFSHINTLLK